MEKRHSKSKQVMTFALFSICYFFYNFRDSINFVKKNWGKNMCHKNLTLNNFKVKFNKRPDLCKKVEKEQQDPAVKRKKVLKVVKRSSSLSSKDPPDPHSDLQVKGKNFIP